MTSTADKTRLKAAPLELHGRSIALVGLMGAGKTTVGRKLAQMLDLPFVDTDHEIEDASRMSVSDLFATYGEAEFRALEARVVARLLDEGPRVIATGGGAFMNEGTRRLLSERSVTVWLKAELDVLMERVSKKPTRPLLQTPDPRATLKALMDQRYPVYAKADLQVQTRNVKREAVAREILDQLERHPLFKAQG